MKDVKGVMSLDITRTLRNHLPGYSFVADGFIIDSDGTGKFLVRVTATGADDEEFDSDVVSHFNKRCAKFGLERTDLGRTVRIARKRGPFTIVGIKPRCSKYAIMVKHKNTGKVWRASRQSLTFLD